jgi:hypothetical protein
VDVRVNTLSRQRALKILQVAFALGAAHFPVQVVERHFRIVRISFNNSQKMKLGFKATGKGSGVEQGLFGDVRAVQRDQ